MGTRIGTKKGTWGQGMMVGSRDLVSEEEYQVKARKTGPGKWKGEKTEQR